MVDSHQYYNMQSPIRDNAATHLTCSVLMPNYTQPRHQAFN